MYIIIFLMNYADYRYIFLFLSYYIPIFETNVSRDYSNRDEYLNIIMLINVHIIVLLEHITYI